MDNRDKIEKLLWSIALPGFGQILNGSLLKGIFFILLEFIINLRSNLNTAIIYSFHGNIEEAVSQTNFRWLMFYPCIYMYAAWDAYKYAKGDCIPFSFLPFVLAAYISTIGVIYSPQFKISGILLGPVWLPIICLIAGALAGTMVRHLLIKSYKLSNRI
ncbi:MAG: hypothetical protein ACOYWZ_14270 [Bacillota bacterium]